MERPTPIIEETPRRNSWKVIVPAGAGNSMSLARCARLANATFIILAYIAILWAALGPVDVLRDDRIYVGLWYTAFVCRTAIFHVGLLSLVVVALAMVLRQYRLTIFALPVLMVTLLPSAIAMAKPIPSERAPSNVRVMTFNAYWHNANSRDGIAEISHYKPDVVVIQECSPVWQSDLPAKLGEQYPYSFIGRQSGSYSSAILSKFPLLGQPQRYAGYRKNGLPAVRVTIDVNGQQVALYNVHLFRPIPSRLRKMRKQLSVLRERIENENMPVIAAGDFNFTGLSKLHESLLDIGLTDAHDAVGQGRGTTWPKTSTVNWLPGFRIDHVYMSKKISPVATQIGFGAGSDHRPLIVDMNLVTK